MIDKVNFKSGFSIGKGITCEFKSYKNSDGVNYGDTPGLSDIEMRKQAAEEITKALKMNGNFKIIFVVTIEAGRVRVDDVTTINIILGSVNIPNISFGVILNKISKNAIKKIQENDEEFKNIFTSLNTGNYKTDKIILNPYVQELDDEDDVLYSFGDLKEFCKELPFQLILPEQVQTMDVDSFQKKKEEYESIVTKLKNDQNSKEKNYNETIEHLKKQQKEIEEEEKKKLQELEEKKKEMLLNEERQKQIENEYQQRIYEQQQIFLKEMQLANENQKEMLELQNKEKLQELELLNQKSKKEMLFVQSQHKKQIRSLQTEINQARKKKTNSNPFSWIFKKVKEIKSNFF